MGLFDQIAAAINDPNAEASTGQLNEILDTVQHLSQSQNLSTQNTQDTMSVLSGFVRSALQDKRANQGSGSVQELVNQFSGNRANMGAVNAIFSPAQQQQVAQAISQRTGIDSRMIMGLLPALIPVVLNMLKTGTDTRNPRSASNNNVLNSFLDSDGDGDVDITDAMRMAGRFMR
ncbi:MAG: DUF937 domain-containing protein [Microcoleaceae cyanobacterium]